MSELRKLQDSGRVLVCIECDANSSGNAPGWCAMIADDPDEPGDPEVVVYCPECAARELGEG
jgi:hypothetical protein